MNKNRMMEIHVITALPELLDSPLNTSMMKRAQQHGAVSFLVHDLRRYGLGKHQQIDDYPYGGGAGMILKPEPIFACVQNVQEKFNMHDCPLIYLSPAGTVFDQKKATELSFCQKLFLLCGHYKGIDERVREELVAEEISIGDYILTGGELAACVIIDSVVRLLPGVLGDIDSADSDSFQTGLLDYPHYTRPEEFAGKKVPKILLSGNHAEIEKWRAEKALDVTKHKRPDLYKKYHE